MRSYKSKKGYYYKIYKNGKKKRISKKEYQVLRKTYKMKGSGVIRLRQVRAVVSSAETLSTEFKQRIKDSKTLVLGAGYRESETSRLNSVDSKYIGINTTQASNPLPTDFLNSNSMSKFFDIVNKLRKGAKFETIVIDRCVLTYYISGFYETQHVNLQQDETIGNKLKSLSKQNKLQRKVKTMGRTNNTGRRFNIGVPLLFNKYIKKINMQMLLDNLCINGRFIIVEESDYNISELSKLDCSTYFTEMFKLLDRADVQIIFQPELKDVEKKRRNI